MLNFQVHDVNEMIKHLEHLDVPLAKPLECNEFGKFIWIKDPEGRLIELWEKQFTPALYKSKKKDQTLETGPSSYINGLFSY